MSRVFGTPLLGCALLFMITSQVLPAALPATPSVRETPAPPKQPLSGPGGAETVFGRVVATHVLDPAPGYRVFEPADPHDGDDALMPLPVVLFFGGCCMPDQTSAVVDFYRVWIEHIVQRGAIVLYPTFRIGSAGVDVFNFVRDLSGAPQKAERPARDWSRLTVVGHSYGGVLAADYAATAPVLALPVPSAVMLAMPGCQGCTLPTNLKNVADSTRMIILVGDADTVVGSTSARAIWSGLTQVPLDQRDFVTMRSDDHGVPPLIADHGLSTTALSEGADSIVDAFDWYGPWKWADALMACAFTGEWCEYALGDTPEQRSLGVWSDGVPVQEPIVTDNPEMVSNVRKRQARERRVQLTALAEEDVRRRALRH